MLKKFCKFFAILLLYIVVLFIFAEIISYNFVYGDFFRETYDRKGIITAISHFRIPDYISPTVIYPDIENLCRFENELSFDKEKRPLLFMGCSYTWGQGIEDSYLNFSSQIQSFSHRKTYNLAYLGDNPENQLIDLYYIKRFPPVYNNFEYIIYTVMYDHISRIYRLAFFSQFMSKQRYLSRNKSLKNKITYYILDKSYTFKLLHNRKYVQYDDIKKSYFKWIMHKFSNSVKELYPDTKFVILLYDDITNTDNEDILNKPMYKEILHPSFYDFANNKDVIVLSTKDLVGDILWESKYQIDNDKNQVKSPHHPNEKAWELIVPALCKKINL